MAPEVESHDARLARLEERQKSQETSIGAVLKVAEDAKESAMEAKDAIVSMNQTIALMPHTIAEEIARRNGGKWNTANQWLILAVAIAAPFVAKWLGV